MTGFPINPPRTAMVDQNGACSAEWYRFFVQIQKMIGGPVSPFDDAEIMASPGSIPMAIVSNIQGDMIEPNYGGLVASLVSADAAPAGGLTVGDGECDFGATPTNYGTVTIADAGITALSSVWAWVQGADTTVDNDAAMHTQAAIAFQLSPSPSAGSLTIEIACTVGFVTGLFKIRYGYV